MMTYVCFSSCLVVAKFTCPYKVTEWHYDTVSILTSFVSSNKSCALHFLQDAYKFKQMMVKVASPKHHHQF